MRSVKGLPVEAPEVADTEEAMEVREAIRILESSIGKCMARCDLLFLLLLRL